YAYAPTPISGSLDISANGFLGGIQAGYNLQSGSFVYGVEADVQLSAVEATTGGSVTVDERRFAGEIGTEVEWLGALRASAGVTATNQLLAYVTGGAAYGRINSFVSVDGLIDENVKNTEWGWTAGAGAEYAATQNITLKTEYLYTDLGKASLIAAPGISLEND